MQGVKIMVHLLITIAILAIGIPFILKLVSKEWKKAELEDIKENLDLSQEMCDTVKEFKKSTAYKKRAENKSTLTNFKKENG